MRLIKAMAAACALAVAGVVAVPASAQAQVNVDDIVGYDTFRGASISGDGRYIVGIRREPVGDVVIVLDWETKQVTPISFARAENNQEIVSAQFKGNNRVIFILNERVQVVPGRGRINRRAQFDDGFLDVQRVYAADIDGSNLISLYEPSQGTDIPRWVSARIVSALPADRDHVLMVAPRIGGAELRRVNVHTAEATVIDRGSVDTFNWVVDANGTPVLRQEAVAGGRGFAWSRRALGDRRWQEVVRFRGDAAANSGPTFEGVGAAVQPGQVFVLARPETADTSALFLFDANTGEYAQEILSVDGFDVSSAVVDRSNDRVLAACYWEYRWRCEPQDNEFRAHWAGIRQALGDDVNIRVVSGGPAASVLLFVDGPRDPGTYYRYEFASNSLDYVASSRPNANSEEWPMAEVYEYVARDGFNLWGYLWRPTGAEDVGNLPLIVVPHGGPESRDVWGVDIFASYWAGQGYAVFQPNFRGGGGFGRAFVEAGHRQWGQRMQQDVRDGAQALVDAGIVDRDRICIAGWSYGGYTAMTASFVDADFYQCAMAGAGVSDLLAMQEWERRGDTGDVITGGGGGTQSVSYQYWATAIGDPNQYRDMLIQYSAARNVERIGMPMLIFHGDEDQTVPVAQSQMLYDRMQAAGKPAEMVIFPDMDHFFTPDQGDEWRVVLTQSVDFFREHIGPGWRPGQD